MDASTVAVRLASSALVPLVRKLFVRPAPGAGLVEEPVRIAGLVSFRGEKRTLGEAELRTLAGELVARAARAYGPHEGPGDAVRREVTDALTTALHSLGDLDMDDVQAVRLGADGLAARLARPAGLSAEAAAYAEPLLNAACLHILNFFTQRSTFVARTLVDQARAIDRLIATTDLLLERVPSRRADDARFEARYAEHIARKHSELTIYGLDLNHAREWRLDAAYVSLEAVCDTAVPVPAESAFSARDRVLLRGSAGSGKTTLVQWLAVTAARQDYTELGGDLSPLVGRVPFVLPLRRVMRDGAPPTPDAFLHAVRSAVAGAQPYGWADRVLTAGRALLLVDGIDEIPPAEREEVRRWLRELMGDFPGNLWLVTARPSAVGEDWLTDEGFSELSLSVMSRDHVTRFVRRWHEAAHTGPEPGQALLEAIRTNADLGMLAVNPLMCGLLCALHRERRGFLPHGRKDLYDAALRMLLERRDVERGVAAGDGLRLSSETQILLLQKLAHWMIRNDRPEMDRADALTQLGRALEYMAHVPAPPEEVLGHLLVRSGLLREPAAGRVDFVHRTFQDYLGAKAVVEEGDFPLLLDNAHKDQWEDVVRMAVALGRPAERERILRGLIGTHASEREARARAELLDDWDQVRPLRRVLLAASCLEHATEVGPGVRRQVVSMAERIVRPGSKRQARLLAELAGPKVLGLLPRPDGLTDEEAVRVLVTATRVGTQTALPVLARFRDHPSLLVRRQLAWSWYKFDTREYAEEIVARLDETDLYFTAHDNGHLRALREMGGRERVQVVGMYRPADLVEFLDADRLTHLWLRDGYFTVGGEEWLHRFPRLHTLVVPERARGTRQGIPGRITVVPVPARAVI
ncbi:NACHT domain-containing protein [Streptomyces sp. NPDC051018]|uniref:NACHT domain-containing protein n=1 Tax=Streptomyces sp. NPDC051018 TaxID=3365639 RepID=UPI0037956E75